MGSQGKKVSDNLLQNEIKKYGILFLGEIWQYKDNLDNFHHLLGYFHVFFTGRISKKGALTGLYSFITVVSNKEEFQSMISLQKTAPKTRHTLSFLIAMSLV